MFIICNHFFPAALAPIRGSAQNIHTDTRYIHSVRMYDTYNTYFWCGTHMLVWFIICFAFSVLFTVLVRVLVLGTSPVLQLKSRRGPKPLMFCCRGLPFHPKLGCRNTRGNNFLGPDLPLRFIVSFVQKLMLTGI